MTLPLRTIRKIHSIKETLAAQAEWEYAAALQQQMQQQSVLTALRRELDDAASLLGSRQTNGVSSAELHAWNRWAQGLRSKIDVQQQLCKQADIFVEKCREKLMQRHQDMEIWQKLQDRNTAQIEQAFRKQEQSEMDELGSRNRKPV